LRGCVSSTSRPHGAAFRDDDDLVTRGDSAQSRCEDRIDRARIRRPFGTLSRRRIPLAKRRSDLSDRAKRVFVAVPLGQVEPSAGDPISVAR
jgi:hypothetical protein